ncbi:MAG: hypothetical protein ACOY4C_12360 [Pseudomonadota bacterium]
MAAWVIPASRRTRRTAGPANTRRSFMFVTFFAILQNHYHHMAHIHNYY